MRFIVGLLLVVVGIKKGEELGPTNLLSPTGTITLFSPPLTPSFAISAQCPFPVRDLFHPEYILIKVALLEEFLG